MDHFEWIKWAREAAPAVFLLATMAAIVQTIVHYNVHPMREQISELRGDVDALRGDVHSMDVRLARVEEAIEHLSRPPG